MMSMRAWPRAGWSDRSAVQGNHTTELGAADQKPRASFFVMAGELLEAQLNEAIAALLEHRPAAPVAFLADFFRHAARPSTPVHRAHRLVRLARPGGAGFADNVVAAYCALDSGGRITCHPHVVLADFANLVQLLCAGLPADLGSAVLDALGPAARERGALSLAQFRTGVEACLQYEALFEACELLHADVCFAAARAGIAPRACAAAVVGEFARSQESRAGLGDPAGSLALLSPERLAAALGRARSGSGGGEDACGALELERAERAVGVDGGRGASSNPRAAAAGADGPGELACETFSRAVFAALR